MSENIKRTDYFDKSWQRTSLCGEFGPEDAGKEVRANGWVRARRDLGGIIIVDFIDMESDAHKKILMDFLRERAQLDRNKTKIVDMTPLGLVEITRHSSRH